MALQGAFSQFDECESILTEPWSAMCQTSAAWANN